MVMSAALDFVDQHWDTAFVEAADASMKNAMKHAEMAFDTITGRPPDVQGLEEVWSGGGKARFDDLLANWRAKLREKLVPYAYAELNV